jgi:citrate lyase subunit beta / citryl-CoA lyase
VLRADEMDLFYARSRVVYASAAAQIDAPIDVVHLALDDPEGLAASAQRGRSLGFGGKACIHPGQIAVVNDAFTPTSVEVEEARAIVTAMDDAADVGVAVHQGKMIDPPVAERARRMLASVREVSAP